MIPNSTHSPLSCENRPKLGRNSPLCHKSSAVVAIAFPTLACFLRFYPK